MDRRLACDCIFGLDVIGDILQSRVLRSISYHSGRGERARTDLLGASAAEFIAELETDHRIHPHAEVMQETTENEIELGLCGPLVPKETLDRQFGVGGWRPLPRHPIWQHGKW